MKSATVLLASLLVFVGPATAADAPAASKLPARLTSATARAAYEEFVAEVLSVAEKQATAFAALETDVTGLSGDKVRTQLALLETFAVTRTQLSQSRRAILGCAQLTREESELLLGELSAVKVRWDKLLADEVPVRKLALTRQLEIAAVAVLAPTAPPPSARTPAEILATAARQLRPMGTALIGGEHHILLDGQRMKAGQSVKVRLDRDYTVTLIAVSKGSYTLTFEGQSLVVPLE